MKALSISIFLLIITLTLSGQNKERIYEDSNKKITYHITQGRFNGNYTSYYKNGNKKAEGNFENNLRIGKWTVWDTLGNIRMERVYSDPFTFERIVPKVPDDKPIELLNIPRYKIKYNKNGYIAYAYVKESDVHYHRRIWRYISPKENPILFEKDLLFKLLTKLILDSNIIAYSTKDDEFREAFMPKIDTSALKVIGFKLKEDFFFDMNRVVSESRIMGVCPIVVNQTTKDTIDAYWVFYPETRKYLSQVKMESDSTPQKIKTLDDLFFYRYFYGRIIKQSTVYDRYLKDYLTGEKLLKEAERIELYLIEQEHNIWINLTKSIFINQQH
ncbi:MAG: hypothetical protein OQJ69_02950 [Flavobacteriales bacterium]|nr:hypothetical protein [Flavobacteriales bacterium]